MNFYRYHFRTVNNVCVAVVTIVLTLFGVGSCGNAENDIEALGTPEEICTDLKDFQSCIGENCRDKITSVDICLFEEGDCSIPYDKLFTCAEACNPRIVACGRTWFACFSECEYEDACVSACNAKRAECIGVGPDQCDSRFVQ